MSVYVLSHFAWVCLLWKAALIDIIRRNHEAIGILSQQELLGWDQENSKFLDGMNIFLLVEGISHITCRDSFTNSNLITSAISLSFVTWQSENWLNIVPCLTNMILGLLQLRYQTLLVLIQFNLFTKQVPQLPNTM